MRREHVRLAAIGAAYLLSAAVVTRIPVSVPPRWAVPGWEVRGLLAFLLPTVAAGICLLAGALASIDPMRANYSRFRATYELTLDAAVLFVVGLHVTLLATLLGADRWPGHLAPLLVGALLVVVGNVMPRVRPNLVVGVRTSWTLASGPVWARTHRIAGTVLVLLGVAIIASAALAPAAVPALVIYGTLAVGLGAAVFSCMLWRAQRCPETPVEE